MDKSNSPNSTILIVDDAPANLDLLFKHLEQTGYQVLVAVDGESALEQAKETQPDIILLDVMMPGIDGFETCQYLKNNLTTQDIPVIFMTALTDVESKVKGFEAGGVDYVTKPIELKEIEVRIHNHLTIHHLQQQLKQKNSQLQQEINERNRIAEALRKTEARYRKLVEVLPDATVVTTPQWKIKLANQRTLDLFGHESKFEVVGRPIFDFIHPDDYAEVTNKLAIFTGSAYWKFRHFEYRLLRPDRQIIPVSVSINPIENETQQLEEVILTFRDIFKESHWM